MIVTSNMLILKKTRKMSCQQVGKKIWLAKAVIYLREKLKSANVDGACEQQ